MSYRIKWDFTGKSDGDRVISGALLAKKHGHGEESRFPIDIVRLDPGVRLLFAVYDPAGGLPTSTILGEVRSTSAQMTLPMLSPAPQGRDFLLAVVNVGTETVRLRGGADQLRPLAGNPAAPILRAEDAGTIGPGAMAILNLNNVSGLWAGVTVHFENTADVKITWGLPGIVLSPMVLIAIASLVLGGTILVLFRRTLRDRQPS